MELEELDQAEDGKLIKQFSAAIDHHISGPMLAPSDREGQVEHASLSEEGLGMQARV